jgi:hypothetical protein
VQTKGQVATVYNAADAAIQPAKKAGDLQLIGACSVPAKNKTAKTFIFDVLSGKQNRSGPSPHQLHTKE